jgi:RNA polymerase sigma-70 factor (ECF subfamily)
MVFKNLSSAAFKCGCACRLAGRRRLEVFTLTLLSSEPVSIKAGTEMVDVVTLEQLQDARSGDATAFTALIAPLVKPAYQLAVGMLQDATEAEDVVQEACLTAWRKLGQLRAATSLRPWFLAIVSSRCRRARRSRWLSVIKQADPAATDVSDPSATVAADLRLACRRLAHEELLVLTLHYCLDLPLDEVGTTLGISREAAKSRLYRAVRKLRPMLDDPEEDSR